MFRPGPPHDRLELPARFSFLDFEIDREAVRASREGRPLALEPKAFDLLLLLAANPGRVVEKQEIFERIWPDAVVTDNALARVVTHLRRELGDSADQARVVETVRTRGYRFLPEIGAPSARSGPSAPDSDPAPRAPARRPLSMAIATGLAATLALLVWWRFSASPATGPIWSATPTQLTVDAGYRGGADFSPDGSQIVYSSDEGGGLQLFVRPLDGGRSIQITSGGGPKVDAAWSPDGRSIAYRDLAANGLWLVAPTGGPPRQITDFGSQPAWFADGERLVFANPGRPTLGALEWPATYTSTLWTVELRTGAVRPLTTPDAEAGGQGMPSVSPDGRWIYFGTGRQIGGGALWRVAATGGRPERLIGVPEDTGELPDYRFWLDPIPLPDGVSLLAIETGPVRRIVRIGLDGSRTVEPLLPTAPAGVVGLALSRDGRRLVYTEERNQTSIEELDLEASDPSAAIRILSAPATLRVMTPRYSPDGARLLIQRRRPGVGPELMVFDRSIRETTLTLEMSHPGYQWLGPTRIALGRAGGFAELDLETGRRREIPNAAGAERLLARAGPRPISRLPGERAMVFTAPAVEGGRELFRGDLESGEAVQLTRLGRSVDYPFVSRDGGWIGFQVAAEAGADNELWRIRTENGPPERLLIAPGPSWGGAFSPDGERIVYAAHRQGRWYLAIAGPASPERLLDVPPETVGYLRWPDWSPDGRHIAYERMRHQATLWSLELPAPR